MKAGLIVCSQTFYLSFDDLVFSKKFVETNQSFSLKAWLINVDLEVCLHGKKNSEIKNSFWV